MKKWPFCALEGVFGKVEIPAPKTGEQGVELYNAKELLALLYTKGLPDDIEKISTGRTSAALVLLKAALHLHYGHYPVPADLIGAAIARLLANDPEAVDMFFKGLGIGKAKRQERDMALSLK